MTDVCVCAQQIFRESVAGKYGKPKSQDGGLCVTTHNRFVRVVVNYTTTTTMHFASSSVSKPNKSTSTLLALFGWSE